MRRGAVRGGARQQARVRGYLRGLQAGAPLQRGGLEEVKDAAGRLGGAPPGTPPVLGVLHPGRRGIRRACDVRLRCQIQLPPLLPRPLSHTQWAPHAPMSRQGTFAYVCSTLLSVWLAGWPS